MVSVGYVGWHGHTHAAYAKGGGDDDDSGDDDSGGDDEKGSKGGDGDDSGSGDEDEDGNVDKDQPLVTAGGLFTLKTYPVREISRPLTMTQKITQVKLSIGTDLSAKGAFESLGLSLEGIHGVTDNFSVIGGFTSAYNTKQYSVYFGFEGALAYDLLDIRLAANLHRFAITRFCGDDRLAPTTCDANSTALPDGHYNAAGSQFSLDLGFPFRYPFSPEIAVIALQTLISIDFNGQERGTPGNRDPLSRPAYCTGVATAGSMATGDMTTTFADRNNCIENGAKPDLNPSIGIATNPIPPLSIVVFAQLRIPDFDTSAGNFQIPVTGRVEFSPNQKLDIGLEFTLLNIKPPDPQTAIDNRFLSAFVQARF
ncbi:MAG TPA: hypothetical protein VGC42_29110 [Kofleriaceae bacterium]